MAMQEAQFQYFWLKVVQAAEVEARSRAALDDPDAEVLSSLVPDHQYVVPQPKVTAARAGEAPDARFTVRLELDPAEAMRHGMTVRHAPMPRPMTREEALAWIHDPAGGEPWARDSLCVLCSVAVEPRA